MEASLELKTVRNCGSALRLEARAAVKGGFCQMNEMKMREGSTDESFLGLPEVLRRVPVSRATLYRMMRRGEFVQARRISRGRVGWPKSEIDKWIYEKARKS